MRVLSKSKLMAFRQCPKRLWLEIHRPELRADSAGTQASFAVGHEVGDIARRLYDPEGIGQLVEVAPDGYDAAFERTRQLLGSSQPIFEAGFSAEGALAFADVMLPVRQGRKRVWHMVEVKSATKLKDYYRDDVAIQAYVARGAGLPLKSIALAHVNKDWVYPGAGDYQGLLLEHDLTEEAFAREGEVKRWIRQAATVAKARKEPVQGTGSQCREPYPCGFFEYCQGQEPQAEFPVRWLPNIKTQALMDHIETQGVRDMRDIPDGLLNEQQRRVRDCSVSGRVYFDGPGAAAKLAHHKLPAYFLDFETIAFPVPVWKGTCPYQQIPFQFSLHRLSRAGSLDHRAHLDLSGQDPSRRLAEALIAACGERGPVFVYYAAFEKARIKELADRFPRLRKALQAIDARIVDLLPVAQQHYYHRDQQGSWSIKAVLPTVVPELGYDTLEGVQDGGMAMAAYREAVSAQTTKARKQQIEGQLLEYCALDTYAMVRLWQHFSGRNELEL